MFGFRFFLTFSMAFCVCVSHWGQAYAVNAATPNLRLVAAAPVKSEKAQKGHSESKVSHMKAGTKAAKSASAKAAKSVPPKKHAAKSATASSHNKPSNTSAVKHRKRGPLPPASAELPQNGIASWVGRYFEGRPVATPGERNVMESFTAAHRAVPFNSILKVTDMHSGRSVLVRVNDRGPYIRGRIIDLAKGAAEYLGYAGRGITTVRLELAGNANDPAQRYYIRMRPAQGEGKAALVRGFGPFDKFDEAASLFMSLYKSYPDAELLTVRETS